MWTVSNSSSNKARGEPRATQIKDTPSRKLPNRPPGETVTDAVRSRSHPRKYVKTTRSVATVSGIGMDQDRKTA